MPVKPSFAFPSVLLLDFHGPVKPGTIVFGERDEYSQKQLTAFRLYCLSPWIADTCFYSLFSLRLAPLSDGGLQAWTQVLMGHLVLINSWG
jgi:hypothetical protein